MDAMCGGHRLARSQNHEPVKVSTGARNDFDAGHGKLAVMLVHHGCEFTDQRRGDMPFSRPVCLEEHLSEAFLDTVNVLDIELPEAGAGNERGDEDDLRDVIDQRSVRLAVAQALEHDPGAKRKI